MSTSKVIDYIKDHKITGPVSPAQLSRDMRESGITISRMAIYDACTRNGIPIQGKVSLGYNPCKFCGKPVKIRSKAGQYDKHAKCWAKDRAKNANYVTVTCATCGKTHKRFPSNARAKKLFCNRACRDAGQRSGEWSRYPAGWDPKALRSSTVATPA